MFTKEQIKKITDNVNVEKCSPTTITYTKKFKLNSVRKYCNDGYSPNMIFKEAGFDVKVLGIDRIGECLRRWKKMRNNEQKNVSNKEARGRPKTNFKSKDERIEYLETKIAYIEAENDFLAKLRGLKRE